MKKNHILENTNAQNLGRQSLDFPLSCGTEQTTAEMLKPLSTVHTWTSGEGSEQAYENNLRDQLGSPAGLILQRS